MEENAASVAMIDQLIGRWQQLHAEGRQVTPEELAADSPELVAELARRIALLGTIDTAITPALTQTDDQTRSHQASLQKQVPGSIPASGFTMVEHLVEARFHGRGGLGEVLIARQQELDRPVALKRIRPDQFHEAARQRFIREAAITARLQHPGIVPIHGLGEDDQGPFYTMPFVRGSTLQKAILELHGDDALRRDQSRRSLELRNLLRRFITVCDTMTYAHDQGVVHRDLKPSNIMVGSYGETLVLDWGLAKYVKGDWDDAEPELVAPSLGPSPADLTATGAVLGTPQYMSPEQASGRPAGPASDLYSLGVILYAILTGKSPYHESPPADPLKPMREAALVPPRQRDGSVPRPLEAICLKAMAARPEDRYAGVKDLGEDVARWLADEPVSAHREGFSARLGRWARRHRASVQAAALALLVVAVLALAAAVIVEEARRREKAALGRVTLALAAELQAKALAQTNLRVARQAVDDYFTKISENDLLKRQDAAEVRDLRTLRKELLEVALEYYNRLASRTASDPALRTEQAAAYTRVGRINDEIGSKSAALAAYQEAQSILSELEAQKPGDIAVERELALSQINVAGLLADIGRASESLSTYARGQEILERLAQSRPADAEIQSELARVHNGAGVVLRSLGRPEEAIAAFERGRAAVERLALARSNSAEDQRRLATAHSNIGLFLNEIGRTDQAIAALEQCRLIDQRLLDASPSAIGIQSDLATCYNNLGLLYSGANRPELSLAALARGREIFQRLVKAHPSVTGYRRDLANNHINSGNVHSATGHPARALAEFEQARAMLQPLFDADPSDVENRRSVAINLFNIGDALRTTGKIAQARRPAEQACALMETFADRAPFEEFVLACAHDLCADVFDKGAVPPSAGDRARRESHASQALAALRRAVAGGYRAFDPKTFSFLQSRPEFQDLTLDLAFPDWPFVGQRPH